jgi:putative membrane protein
MRAPVLDAGDRRRIEQAVRDAERATSGEIVVAVVRACDEYGSAGWRCGVLGAALALLALAALAPPLSLGAVLGAQAAALAAGHALARLAPVRRFFVSEELLERAARRRAAASFTRHGLGRTEGGTGILLLVALFERRVVVLADEGVDRRLDPGQSWQEVVDLVLAGIRAGRAADGIVAAVRRCGDILSHPLPAREGEPDEIPHALVIDD